MAKREKTEGNSERLFMRISPEEIEAIDDWRFANRIPSRSEAVRRLTQIGITSSRNESYIATSELEFLLAFEVLEGKLNRSFELIEKSNSTVPDDLRESIFDTVQDFTNFMLCVGVFVDRVDSLRDQIKSLSSEGAVSHVLQSARVKSSELRSRSEDLMAEVNRIRNGEAGPKP